MKRGRRPKPVALKILQGNPGRRTLNTSINPTVEKLGPPFFIKGEGLAEWNRLEPELRRIGILTTVDYAVFVAYCGAYGRLCAAEKILQSYANPQTAIVINAGMTRNPVARARDDAELAMIRFAAELGITPSSRGQVSAASQNKQETNPFALIDGGKK